MKSGVLYNDISDHFPVFNLLQIDSKITKKYEYIFKRTNTAKKYWKTEHRIEKYKMGWRIHWWTSRFRLGDTNLIFRITDPPTLFLGKWK